MQNRVCYMHDIRQVLKTIKDKPNKILTEPFIKATVHYRCYDSMNKNQKQIRY